jgi:hypothetical protein
MHALGSAQACNMPSAANLSTSASKRPLLTLIFCNQLDMARLSVQYMVVPGYGSTPLFDQQKGILMLSSAF